jgi:hypothetical protein
MRPFHAVQNEGFPRMRGASARVYTTAVGYASSGTGPIPRGAPASGVRNRLGRPWRTPDSACVSETTCSRCGVSRGVARSARPAGCEPLTDVGAGTGERQTVCSRRAQPPKLGRNPRICTSCVNREDPGAGQLSSLGRPALLATGSRGLTSLLTIAAAAIIMIYSLVVAPR